MYYNRSLSRILDNVFLLPFSNVALEDNFVYDSIKADNDGSTIISVVMPGFSKQDLELVVNDNKLVLTSKLESRKLNRNWSLSDSVDVKNIAAECKDGILTIKVPQKSKPDRSRNIEIK